MIHRHHYITRNISIPDLFHTERSRFSFIGFSLQSTSVLIRGGNSVLHSLSPPPPPTHPPKQIIAGFYSKQDACIHYNIFFYSLSDSLVKHDSNSTG